MALFFYKAVDKNGKTIEDSIQVSSIDEAASILASQSLKVLSIKPVKASFGLPSSISVNEKANFCRFLATMLKSGMSIPESVEIIRQETKNAKLQKVLSDIAYQTQKGKSLSSVLAQYKNDFDPIFLTMVRVGEQSGTLEKSFIYLAKQLAASHELSQKVKGSMMYPAVIVVAMGINGLVMVIFVLPKIAQAFLKLDVPLPFYTKALLTFGDFVGKNIPLVIGTIIVGAISAVGAFMVPNVRRAALKLFTRIPGVNGVVREIDVARYARTLSTLLKNGVPVVEALDVSAEGMSEAHMREVAGSFSKRVSHGESLADILVSKRDVFPSLMVQTIRAGEKTGNLEDSLSDMADFYESEVDFSLKRLTGLLEPVLMLLIGAVVGVMVIIMIAPIYSIIGGLQNTIEQQ